MDFWIGEAAAKSPFRIQSILQTHHNVEKLIAQNVFFSQPAAPELRTRLSSLLHASIVSKKSNLDSLIQGYEKAFLVIPRESTISAWSSKATDILHIAGLTSILRVEHGILYAYSLRDTCTLNEAIEAIQALQDSCYDRMTERILQHIPAEEDIFAQHLPTSLQSVSLADAKTKEEAISILKKANVDWGLALSNPEMEYLVGIYKDLDRSPTDAELFMFAQVSYTSSNSVFTEVRLIQSIAGIKYFVGLGLYLIVIHHIRCFP